MSGKRKKTTLVCYQAGTTYVKVNLSLVFWIVKILKQKCTKVLLGTRTWCILTVRGDDTMLGIFFILFIFYYFFFFFLGGGVREGSKFKFQLVRVFRNNCVGGGALRLRGYFLRITKYWILAHLSHWLISLDVRRPSCVVNNCFKGHLLLNYRLEFDQTWQEWALYDPF